MRRETRLNLRYFLQFLLVWIILPGIILLVLRLAWGWQAGYRLASLKHQLNAGGYPTGLEAYQSPAIPPGQNAYAALAEANLAFSTLSNDDRDLIFGTNKPTSPPYTDWTPEEQPSLDAIFTAHPEILSSLAQAVGRKAIGWPPRFPLDFDDKVVSLGSLRTLIDYIIVASLRAHAHGHDALALQDLHLAFAVTRMADENPTLLSHLVAIACYNLTGNTFEKLEPELKWNDPDVITAARIILDDLRCEQQVRHALLRAWQGDPVKSSPEMLRWMPELKDFWLLPLASDIDRRNLETAGMELPAIQAGSWPQAKALYVPEPEHASLQINNLAFQIEFSAVSYRFILLHMRGVATINANAILLAARLAFQQSGQFPRTTEELRPTLGNSLLDPFAAAGTPLHYRVDPGGPTVWSVGENGIDDGGTFPPGISPSPHWRTANDEIFGAARHAATTAPAASP